MTWILGLLLAVAYLGWQSRHRTKRPRPKMRLFLDSRIPYGIVGNCGFFSISLCPHRLSCNLGYSLPPLIRTFPYPYECPHCKGVYIVGKPGQQIDAGADWW